MDLMNSKSMLKTKMQTWASEITGIGIEDIEKLSTEIAMNQPVGIRIGVATI